LLRSHPPSPLFPYTTLFRSHRIWPKSLFLDGTGYRMRHSCNLFSNNPPRLSIDKTPASSHRGRNPLRCGGEASAVILHQTNNRQDRKSTRLNSSHVKISYAV